MNIYILPFIAATLIINLTPGPAMLYCVNTSIHHGTKSGIAAAIGVELGTFFYILLTVFGLSALIIASPNLYTGLRIAGSCYLLYLAYKSFPRANSHQYNPTINKRRKLNALFGGILINVMNPKILLFFLTFLPQFVPIGHQTNKMFFILGITFNISGFIVNMSAAIFSKQLHGYFSRTHHRTSKILSYMPSILFLLIAVLPILLEYSSKSN